MEIISYGVASKAGSQVKKTEGTLGEGVEGTYPHVKGRIDGLEQGIEKVNESANQLIINDAVNIMKAHARLNAIAKTKKYNMHNMIFDDLLDLSGINTLNSSGYSHDETEGSITAISGNVLQTKPELTDVIPEKIIIALELTGSAVTFISRDGGETFESIIPGELFYFSRGLSPGDNQLCLKVELTSGSRLHNYALTWV